MSSRIRAFSKKFQLASPRHVGCRGVSSSLLPFARPQIETARSPWHCRPLRHGSTRTLGPARNGMGSTHAPSKVSNTWSLGGYLSQAQKSETRCAMFKLMLSSPSHRRLPLRHLNAAGCSSGHTWSKATNATFKNNSLFLTTKRPESQLNERSDFFLLASSSCHRLGVKHVWQSTSAKKTPRLCEDCVKSCVQCQSCQQSTCIHANS